MQLIFYRLEHLFREWNLYAGLITLNVVTFVIVSIYFDDNTSIQIIFLGIIPGHFAITNFIQTTADRSFTLFANDVLSKIKTHICSLAPDCCLYHATGAPRLPIPRIPLRSPVASHSVGEYSVLYYQFISVLILKFKINILNALYWLKGPGNIQFFILAPRG